MFSNFNLIRKGFLDLHPKIKIRRTSKHTPRLMGLMPHNIFALIDYRDGILPHLVSKTSPKTSFKTVNNIYKSFINITHIYDKQNVHTNLKVK